MFDCIKQIKYVNKHKRNRKVKMIDVSVDISEQEEKV